MAKLCCAAVVDASLAVMMFKDRALYCCQYRPPASPSTSLANRQSTRSVSYILGCSWRAYFSLVHIRPTWHKCFDQGRALNFSVNAFPTLLYAFYCTVISVFRNSGQNCYTQHHQCTQSQQPSTQSNTRRLQSTRSNLLVSVNGQTKK